MVYLLCDLEANGYNPDRIWCICTKEYPSGIKKSFLDMKDFVAYVKDLDPDWFVFHNGLKYDVPVVQNLIDPDLIPLSKVIDTYVCSQLFDYKKFQTHSISEIGKYLGVHKGEYTGGFEAYSPEMLEYCEQDVEVLEALFLLLLKDIEDPAWKEALKTEQDMAYLCYVMNSNGFTFDFSKASELLKSVEADQAVLEANFKEAFPPKLVESKRLKYRKTKEGKLFSAVQKAMDSCAKYEVKGSELICYEYKDFNPGSGPDKIDVLWDAGWKPFEKTKGHIAAEREAWKENRRQWRK